jgi:hypothetical protein
VLVSIKSFGAAAGAGQGPHELRVQVPAQRIPGSQIQQPADELLVPVKVHLGIDMALDRLQAQLVQARNLPLAQQIRWYVGQRRATPQVQRRASRSKTATGYPPSSS